VHQLCREIYGGVVDHINENHISTVMIPVLEKDEQNRIGDRMRKASQLKEDAIYSKTKRFQLLNT